MRVKTLSTLGLVTDRTAQNLRDFGWQLAGKDEHRDNWIDPSTGRAYKIGEAEAIRLNRFPSRYRFDMRSR